jgi:hypothetical protein
MPQKSSQAPVCLVFVQIGVIDVTQHDRDAWVQEHPAFVVVVQVPAPPRLANYCH